MVALVAIVVNIALPSIHATDAGSEG